MTGFQNTINRYQALGVPGEIAFDGPTRAAPFVLNSSGVANQIGNAFTRTAGADPQGVNAETAQVGGTGLFAGILCFPKEYTSYGVAALGGSLATNSILPDNSIGTLVFMGEIFVNLGNAANVGDAVYFDNTSGALGSVAANFNGTGAISATTLTVSATTAGALGVGSAVKGANVLPGTYITALGTGTGGNGTYTVNQTQTAASAAISAEGIAPAGKTLIPRTKVDRYPTAGAGLAVINLLN